MFINEGGAMTEIYLVKRGGAWFRPNARGYTTEISAAGHYTKADAESYLYAEGVTIHPASEVVDQIKSRRDTIAACLARAEALIDSLEHAHK